MTLSLIVERNLKERDSYLCQVCKDNDRYNYDDLEVHHIVPLEEDCNLRLDDDNLITLCVAHHKQADRGEISEEYVKGLIDIPPTIKGLIF